MRLAILNDGEIAVLIPFSTKHMKFVYRRASTKRRLSMTPEEFQKCHGLMDDADGIKACMLETLGITQREMNEALQQARTDNAESHYLWALVRASRKKRTTRK